MHEIRYLDIRLKTNSKKKKKKKKKKIDVKYYLRNIFDETINFFFLS